jgi:phosphinothricin acetyltransferase
VFPENAASIALHERAGFRVVGRRERIAELGGVWRDTLFLELRIA